MIFVILRAITSLASMASQMNGMSTQPPLGGDLPLDDNAAVAAEFPCRQSVRTHGSSFGHEKM
jgi:hypothetical protein